MSELVEFIFAAPTITTARIHNSTALFPVHRVYCVGRNYAAHAREMGRDPDREPPFFFTKWADTVVQTSSIPYPPQTQNYHYEGELVIAIGKGGANISAANARDHIFGYAAGSDMTRRDLQLASRELGRPWDTGKNVEASAPIAAIHPASEVGHLETARIELRLNGQVKQSATISDMIWSCEEIIEHVSKFYTLQAGDLIFTGTPEGVGAVKIGDQLEVEIMGLEVLRVTIAGD
jgi:fumarylpyruvate hydrolase